ncbi:hypothetical protein J6590_046218 [Homalodisca vitripennis]|nr:hypothetical protein J6590_046218 [Homalodisca vitripennis]
MAQRQEGGPSPIDSVTRVRENVLGRQADLQYKGIIVEWGAVRRSGHLCLSLSL